MVVSSKKIKNIINLVSLVDNSAGAANTNQSMELNTKIDRTNAIIVELANVVYEVSNRQEDHEHRITRLEDRL